MVTTWQNHSLKFVLIQTRRPPSTLKDARVLPTSSAQTGESTTAAAPTAPLLPCASQHSLTGLFIGLPSQAGHNSSYLSGIIEWTFT